MTKAVYRVFGYTKKGGMVISRAMDIEADSKQEAIEAGKKFWDEYNNAKAPCYQKHLFRIGARRLAGTEEIKFNFWHICNQSDL